MDIKDGLLGKVPFVTILVAIAMTATFAASQIGGGADGGQFEELLLRAQVFYERNPDVELGARGRSLLGSEFVGRVQSEHAAAHDKPVFSQRMRDRTQSKFDRIVDDALTARIVEDPAWSEGITGPGVPFTRYLTYALFHEGWLAVAVTLAFLLLAGLGLEMSWGALVQAPTVVLSIFAGGLVFAHLDAAGHVPLTGGGPLVASLLAAYLVRGVGGNLPLPGALLLPVWLFVDALFVRGIWIDNLGDWPFATLGVSMVLGAGIAGAIRLMGLEAKLVDTVDSLAEGQHPAFEAADRLKNLGRPRDAYDTLAAAAADEPGHTGLVLAWWDVAIEIGRAEEVAHAILPILQSELRSGDVEAATTHWRQVMASGAPVQVNTTLLVRMGEALLDSGEPEQALDTLRRALDSSGPMGSALAQRVVRIARDLDPVLTARAAEVALRDPQMPDDMRIDLEALAGGGSAGAPHWDAQPAAEASLADSSPIAPDASASGQAIDAGPGELSSSALDLAEDIGGSDALDGLDDLVGMDHGEIDLSHVGDLASPDDFAELDSGAEGLAPLGLDTAGGAGAPEVETDPNALSIHSIEREFAGGLDAEDATAGLAGGEPDAWNDPGRVEDLSGELDADGPALMGEGDLDEPVVDNSYIEAGALSADALSSETDAVVEGDIVSGRDELTPDALASPPAVEPSSGSVDLLDADGLSGGLDDLASDATDPLTMPDQLDASPLPGHSPLSDPGSPSLAEASPLAAPDDAHSPPTEPMLDRDLMAAKVEQARAEEQSPVVSAATSAAPDVVAAAATTTVEQTTRVEGLETAGMAAGAGASSRALKVLDAVPLALEPEAIKFDVEGRGKTRLPFGRIDAVAVAAVAGLSAKPVLVIDFVLNWGAAESEPLKVIRVRSDGFNPVALVGSSGSPLESIKTLIRRVLDGAQATPLPDVGAAMGSPFSTQPDLAAYERDVLQAG